MERLYTAYHEAGHIAALLKYGHVFTAATIQPAQEYQGAVFITLKAELFKHLETGDLDPAHERYFKQYVIMSMAGPAAEAKKRRHTNIKKSGPFHDFDNVLDIVTAITGSDKVAGKYIDYAISEAKFLFDYDCGFENPTPLWNFVEAMAARLMETTDVSYSECMAIFLQTMNSG